MSETTTPTDAEVEAKARDICTGCGQDPGQMLSIKATPEATPQQVPRWHYFRRLAREALTRGA